MTSGRVSTPGGKRIAWNESEKRVLTELKSGLFSHQLRTLIRGLKLGITKALQSGVPSRLRLMILIAIKTKRN